MNFLASHLLTLILFVPTAGAALLLLLPSERTRLLRWTALGVSLIPFALSLAAWARFQPAGAGFQLQEQAGWYGAIDCHLPPGHRRHLADHDAADHAAHAAGAAGILQYRRAPEGISDPVPAARDRHVGRVPVARPAAVLRVLGSGPGANVLPDQSVGRRESQLRLAQVHPVHHGRLAWAAAGDPGDRAGLGHVRPAGAAAALAHPASHKPVWPAGGDCQGGGLLGIRDRLRSQGAGLAVPYLAAGRPYRSAHGRLDDPGGRAAQAGRVRFLAAGSAALPG